MENIMVFATSVESRMAVSALAPALDRVAGKGKWNFDLEDCDRILRVVDGRPQKIIRLLTTSGFRCTELGDEVPQEEWTAEERIAS